MGHIHDETMGPLSTGTERVTRNLIKANELNLQEIEVSTDNTTLADMHFVRAQKKQSRGQLGLLGLLCQGTPHWRKTVLRFEGDEGLISPGVSLLTLHLGG